METILMIMHWINLLHIYQPPWQDKETVKKIADGSYRYLLNILKKYSNAKITLNICGSLSEHLVDLGYFDIIEDIKKFVRRGQIELTGSVMYHAFLPLLPESEILRQIELNERYGQKLFGKEIWFSSQKRWGERGFFIPEMAYSKKVAKIIARLGFSWVILDEISLGGKLGNVNWEKKYFIKNIKSKNKNLAVIFRDRKIYCRSFSGKTFDTIQVLEMAKRENMLRVKSRSNNIILTARDGESYNDQAWNKKKDETFKNILRNKKIKNLTVSEYLNYLDKTGAESKIINPTPSTWESLESEIKQGKPYEIWSSRENPIHRKFWRFINLVIGVINQNKKDKNFYWARHHLDRGLASCGLWWADGRFKGYNPEEVEKNASELIRSVRSLKDLTKNKKIYFEKLYSSLIYSIWERHWKIKSQN
jgi:alpha-amylase/alpha-mannosidase (GH57 family)